MIWNSYLYNVPLKKQFLISYIISKHVELISDMLKWHTKYLWSALATATAQTQLSLRKPLLYYKINPPLWEDLITPRIFSCCRWGSLFAQHFAQPPINTCWNFRLKCLQSHLQKFLQTIKSHTYSFGTIGQLLKFNPYPAKCSIVRGILISLWIRSACKISEP